jgi:uncharacterized protein with HEPN domain
MTEQSSKYLTDILMAIELIEDFTKDIIASQIMSAIEKHKVLLNGNLSLLVRH